MAHQSITVSISHLARSRFRQSLVNNLRNTRGHFRIREGRESCVIVVRRAGFDLGKAIGERFTDFLRVTRYPNSRSVDARASAVVGNRADHYVEILFPVIDTILTDDDLAVTRTMNLDA